MSLGTVLDARRRAVLDDWLERIAASYPHRGEEYLTAGNDRFSNPVATTLTEAAEGLFDALRCGAGPDELGILLDPPVRLRAVQQLSPSEAVGFVFELKGAVRRALASEIRKGRLEKELVDFEQRVDLAALAAFDAFMDCREHMYKLRAVETRNAAQRLLERAGLALPESPIEPVRTRASQNVGKE
jgi:hypothetical protein